MEQDCIDDSPLEQAVQEGEQNMNTDSADTINSVGDDPTMAEDEVPNEEEQPKKVQEPKRAGWFAISHDDIRTVLEASSGITGSRNLSVWVMLLRIANKKRSLEFDISCEVLGADLRGVDRRTVRAALEILQECELISMSAPERNTATNRYKPTTIILYPTCSPVRSRAQKKNTGKKKPCAKNGHGDADMVTQTIQKIAPRGSYKSPPWGNKSNKKDISSVCSANDVRGAGNNAPTHISANGGRKRVRSSRSMITETITPELKVKIL